MPALHHSVFYRLDALPATQPTASKLRYSTEDKVQNMELSSRTGEGFYMLYGSPAEGSDSI